MNFKLIMLILLSTAACGVEHMGLQPQPEAAAVRLSSAEERRAGQVVKDSYIVTFRSYPGASQRRFASFRDEYRHHFSYLAGERLTDPRVKDLRYLASVDLAYPHDPKSRQMLQAPRSLSLAWDQTKLDELPAAIAAVDFTSHEAAKQTLKEWEESKAIWFAEPNYKNRLLSNPFTSGLASNYQNAGIWWHQKIKLPEALQKLSQATVNTTQTPIIAVLDSGLDIEHPLLKNHIFTNPSPGGSSCGNDLHGCDTSQSSRGNLGVDTVYPYGLKAYNTACDTMSVTSDIDVCEHGTHVAGIIASDLSSTSGDTTAASALVGGVCPVCQILPIKIIGNIDGGGAASDEAIINGLQYVALFRSGDRGAVRVVNSSFGKYAPNRAVALLVSVLSESSSQVLTVAAASNEDSMLRSYPAAYPGALGVAATGQEDEKASSSNFGPGVQVSAPGGNSVTGQEITSTLPGGRYGDKQGTSMAAPVVAGVAGLLLAYNQNLSVRELFNSIVSTADPRIYKSDVNGGDNYNYYDPVVSGYPNRWPLLGSGIVDASAALDGKSANYTGNIYNRVQAGCGVVAASESTPSMGLWLLLLPMILAVI